MVVGEIKRYMRDNGAIKVSRSMKILANRLNRFIDEYQLEHDDSPSIEFLAQKFGVQEDEVVVALDSAKMPVSIYAQYDDEDDAPELIEKLPCSDHEDGLITKIHLSNIIDGLNERERKIIILRYFRDRTQSEIAKILGVSQVQVSRLENKIIGKMRLKF